MNNVQIADLISKECKQKNIKISELLQDCNINHSFISDIRHKNRAPSVDKISVIADYLDVSVDYLLGRTDTPNTYSISNQDTTINGTQANVINNAEKQDEMTEELLKAFKSMSFPDKMDIMNAVLAKSEKKA